VTARPAACCGFAAALLSPDISNVAVPIAIAKPAAVKPRGIGKDGRFGIQLRTNMEITPLLV
jgi:hypothetical protein